MTDNGLKELLAGMILYPSSGEGPIHMKWGISSQASFHYMFHMSCALLITIRNHYYPQNHNRGGEIEMSTTKPIIFYSHARGPVPWRVAIILEELKVPYESKYLESPEMNSEPFNSLNPNSKVPAIEDPNTGVKLFEVGRMS